MHTLLTFLSQKILKHLIAWELEDLVNHRHGFVKVYGEVTHSYIYFSSQEGFTLK